MVAIPVCSFDLKTGVFCPTCESRIKSGQVTKLDLSIIKLLLEVERSFPFLQSAKYVKSVEHEDLILVALGEGDLLKVTQKDVLALQKRLSQELGRRVKVIEDKDDVNALVESIAEPARIIAVNKIWLPGDEVVTRIILDDERNLKMSKESLEQLVGKMKSVTLKVDFQRKYHRHGEKRKEGGEVLIKRKVAVDANKQG